MINIPTHFEFVGRAAVISMRDGLPSESDTLLVLIRSGLEFRERLKS